MTHDEIIRVARESGFEIGSVTSAIYAPTSCEMELTRFSERVAAAEREACAAMVKPLDESLAEAIRARGKA